MAKKIYETPDMEIEKFTVKTSVFTESQQETTKGYGGGDNQGEF